MRKAGFFAVALVISALPAATASDSWCRSVDDFQGCIVEEDTQNGTCETRDYHSTEITLRSSDGVWLRGHGWQDCGPQGWEPGTYSTTAFEADGVFGDVVWHETTTPSGTRCSIAYYGLQMVYQPCPLGIGPPNPGWGHLLP
ncbi:MAG: hypothetical protein WDA16_04620 [Candidatus Thermoplasmatota archaeon]